MWEVTLPLAGELEAQGPYGQHSQLACCGPLKRCGRDHSQSLNIWSGRAHEEKGKEVSRWGLGGCIHCDLSWVDSILFGVQGIKTCGGINQVALVTLAGGSSSSPGIHRSSWTPGVQTPTLSTPIFLKAACSTLKLWMYSCSSLA